MCLEVFDHRVLEGGGVEWWGLEALLFEYVLSADKFCYCHNSLNVLVDSGARPF